MKKAKNFYIHRLPRNQARFITLVILLVFVANFFSFSAVSTTALEKVSTSSQMMLSQRGGWESIESGVTQDINSIFFICLNRGTIVGDEGVILRSGDGGNNWVVQNSGVMENLYGVSYYGYSITVAVGSGGTILYTSNSGMNWSILQTGMMGTYYSCQMVNETVGVAVGVNAIFQPFFTRTNDGWDTWDSSSFYIEHDSVFYEGRLSDVHFIDPSLGFATAIVDVPAGGAIVRTTDGGNIWETVFFDNDALFSIDFSSEGVGYAVGDNGAMVQTLDNGESWQELESGVSIALRGIDFPSATIGNIVGDNGIILRTENEGQTWIQQTSGTTSNLLGVQCLTDKFGVIVGEQGVILLTKTGGYPEDTIPPETTCNLSGTLEGGIYITNVTVNLTATDDSSGVATTMYKLDNASWVTYVDGPFVVSTNGNHLLRFYSTDNAGNIEEEKTCEFTIHHPPNLQISIDGGFGIKILIKNLDMSNITNASWNLSLDGGIILFGKQKAGIVNIEAGDDITLNSLVFGFGKPTITFTVASSQKIVQTSVFLFFVRI
jgi:photosystem II stability/assembly factor-like uncharacterized protein